MLSRLSLINLSSESMTVKTEMIAKIPMVIPSNERKVRNLFALSELKANVKLSSINLMRSIVVIQFARKVKISFFQSEFINKELFETSIFSIKTTLIFLSLRPKIEKGING